MKQVNIYEAKTNLSALVEEARAGAEIVIARNGKPQVRLVPFAPVETASPLRDFGFWADEGYELPESFDDPDPEIEAMFYGEGADWSERTA